MRVPLLGLALALLTLPLAAAGDRRADVPGALAKQRATQAQLARNAGPAVVDSWPREAADAAFFAREAASAAARTAYIAAENQRKVDRTAVWARIDENSQRLDAASAAPSDTDVPAEPDRGNADDDDAETLMHQQFDMWRRLAERRDDSEERRRDRERAWAWTMPESERARFEEGVRGAASFLLANRATLLQVYGVYRQVQKSVDVFLDGGVQGTAFEASFTLAVNKTAELLWQQRSHLLDFVLESEAMGDAVEPVVSGLFESDIDHNQRPPASPAPPAPQPQPTTTPTPATTPAPEPFIMPRFVRDAEHGANVATGTDGWRLVMYNPGHSKFFPDVTLLSGEQDFLQYGVSEDRMFMLKFSGTHSGRVLDYPVGHVYAEPAEFLFARSSMMDAAVYHREDGPLGLKRIGSASMPTTTELNAWVRTDTSFLLEVNTRQNRRSIETNEGLGKMFNTVNYMNQVQVHDESGGLLFTSRKSGRFESHTTYYVFVKTKPFAAPWPAPEPGLQTCSQRQWCHNVQTAAQEKLPGGKWQLVRYIPPIYNRALDTTWHTDNWNFQGAVTKQGVLFEEDTQWGVSFVGIQPDEVLFANVHLTEWVHVNIGKSYDENTMCLGSSNGDVRTNCLKSNRAPNQYKPMIQLNDESFMYVGGGHELLTGQAMGAKQGSMALVRFSVPIIEIPPRL